jgi:hypothetical protein
MAASLGVSRNDELIARQSLASKDVNMKADEAVLTKSHDSMISIVFLFVQMAVVRDKTDSVIQCAVCDKPADVKCGGCLVTCYCSAKCQVRKASHDMNKINLSEITL